MKAIVCVKQVPDTSGKVAVKADGTLDRASMATITNPDDLNALEAALKLKDETGCEVVVVTMGPPPASVSCWPAVLIRLFWSLAVSSVVLIPSRPARSSLLLSIRSVSAPRTSCSAAVRQSTVIPHRSVLRSLRSCTCLR